MARLLRRKALSKSGISDLSDSTAINIDSSEQVGIGTASPSRTLTVQKDATAGSLNTAPVMSIQNHTSAQFTSLDFGGANDNAFIGYKDNASGSGNNRHLSIGFGSTESLVVGKNDKVQIGNVSPPNDRDQQLSVEDNLSVGDYIGATGLYLGWAGGKGTGNWTSVRLLSASSEGSSADSLYWGNQALYSSSDVRLKKNIKVTEINGLEKIKQLIVKDFSWDDPSDTSFNNRNARGVWTGLIAQEAIKVLPFTVNAVREEETLEPIEDSVNEEGKPAYWGMEYDKMVPVLIKAIQELSANNDALETKIDALEARIVALENA